MNMLPDGRTPWSRSIFAVPVEDPHALPIDPPRKTALESNASACGWLNSPGADPSLPQVLINLPSCRILNMREFRRRVLRRQNMPFGATIRVGLEEGSVLRRLACRRQQNLCRPG
jgi:hypothetical protein